MTEVAHELVVDAPIGEVFDMFVDPTKLTSWIGISADLEPRPGGRFRFEVGPGHFCAGQYLEIDRPRRVVFTWGWEGDVIPLAPGASTVEVDLRPDGSRTVLQLRHTGLSTDTYEIHAEGWEQFLARLAAVAAGETPPPDPAAGVDPADVRERIGRQEP